MKEKIEKLMELMEKHDFPGCDSEDGKEWELDAQFVSRKTLHNMIDDLLKIGIRKIIIDANVRTLSFTI